MVADGWATGTLATHSGKKGKGRERKGQEGKGRERNGKDGKGTERKGKEGKERERKGKEGKGRERKGEVDLEISPNELAWLLHTVTQCFRAELKLLYFELSPP